MSIPRKWSPASLLSLLSFKEGSTLRSVTHVLMGDASRTIISFVTNILIARWTLPYDMGVWNAALLVTVYAPTLQAGVFNGVNRQLPYYIGSGDTEKANGMAQAAYAWSLVLTATSTVAGILYVAYMWHQGRVELSYTAAAVAVSVATSWTTLYLTVTYRTHAQFGRLARNTIIAALIGLALTVLVRYMHYNGILLRASLLSVVSLAILYYKRPVPVQPRWNTSALVHLAKIGIPIYVVGQLGTFFTSFDRLMLVKSPQLLGYFTTATQVATFTRLIPIAFSIVLYPKMAHRFGQTHHAMELWYMARKGALAACAAGAAAGCLGWVLLPGMIRLLLPKYVPGTSAAQWASFMGLVSGIYIFDNVYNVIKRQDLYIMNWAIGSAVFFGSWYLLTHRLTNINILASIQSMLIATFVMAIVSSVASWYGCQKYDRRAAAAAAG